jgi:hypothetical protein
VLDQGPSGMAECSISSITNFQDLFLLHGDGGDKYLVSAAVG